MMMMVVKELEYVKSEPSSVEKLSLELTKKCSFHFTLIKLLIRCMWREIW